MLCAHRERVLGVGIIFIEGCPSLAHDVPTHG